MTGALCGDLEQIEVRRPDGSYTPGWLLTVRGKGGRVRQVPVPGNLVQELGEELDRLLRTGDALMSATLTFTSWRWWARTVPSCRLGRHLGCTKAIKRFMLSCAANMEAGDAAALRRASVHWLRHLHGSHAVNGRPGRTPVGGRLSGTTWGMRDFDDVGVPEH